MGKKARNVRNRRAISPVIATVILVAITITVAVAVAYWMGSIAGQYTQFEQVEIQTAVCSLDNYGNWVIDISLKNTGTEAATITNVFVNDDEVESYVAGAPAGAVATITTNLLATTDPYSLGSGDTGSVIIWVGAGYGTLSSGTTVNIKLHSAGGMDYPKLIGLV